MLGNVDLFEESDSKVVFAIVKFQPEDERLYKPVGIFQPHGDVKWTYSGFGVGGWWVGGG